MNELCGSGIFWWVLIPSFFFTWLFQRLALEDDFFAINAQLKLKLTTLSYHLIMEKYEYEDSHYLFPWSHCRVLSSVRLLFHLSLQLLPLLSSPASIAIFGQDRWGFLLLHSMSLWSSSSVHLCLCSFGLAIMDFPAKMEEINPISFPSNILLLKNQRSPIE